MLSMPAGILQNKKHNVACCLQSTASAGIRFAGDDAAHAPSRLLPSRLAAALFARYDVLLVTIPICIPEYLLLLKCYFHLLYYLVLVSVLC